MNQLINYLKQDERALAAYARNLIPGEPIESELAKADFSASQARAFSAVYRAVTQHTDLTATIFVDNATGPAAKDYLLGRGDKSDMTDRTPFNNILRIL
ncbi:MAG: hypothetical protein LZF61_07870 [Nitrosomonas sp.]|nr:MAG: hypothetical protein LZF61_07870 [Nitrosomonas sp.]